MKNSNLIMAILWAVAGVLQLVYGEVSNFSYALAVAVIVIGNLSDWIEEKWG